MRLTKVEMFYIEQKTGILSPEQIATDLNISKVRVVNYQKKLPPKPVEVVKEEPPPPKKDIMDITEDGRSFVMTGRASQAADDLMKGKKRGVNKRSSERLKGKIFIPDPKKPSF